MHGLFSIQREKQRLEPSSPSPLEPSSSSPAVKQPLKVPEFFRHLGGGNGNDKQYILVDDKEIRKTLAEWLYIWHCAASSDIGLAATVATARLSEPTLPSKSILALIDEVIDQSVTQADWTRTVISELPEFRFFNKKGFEDTDEEEDTTTKETESKQFGRKLADCIAAGDLIKRIDGDRENSNPSIFPDPDDVDLFTLLRDLHYKARFPIIPYLLLTIAYEFEIQQCIVPLLNSVEFPVGVLIPGADGKLELTEIPCSVVFLATVNARVFNEEELPAWTLLLRQAAEPFIDTVFYGSIQRRHIETATYGEFFRSITHELNGLNDRLTDRWLHPISDCFDLTEGENKEPAPFGSIAVAPDTREAVLKFRVVTNPALYGAASRHYALWTSSNWLNIMGIADDMLFDDVLRCVIRVAGESHFIRRQFTQIGRDVMRTPKGIARWENARRTDSEKNATRLVEGLTYERMHDVRWMATRETMQVGTGLTMREQAQIFCRLFVAICTNSLKNAEPEQPIHTRCAYDRNSKVLTLTQRNPCNFVPGPPKSDGTSSVLSFLIQSLNGRTDDIIFKKMGHEWVTECKLPAHFLSADGPLRVPPVGNSDA
jgi:hypothetical protein